MFLAEWPGGSWEATVRYIIIILAVYLAALWITLVFWAYRDIRQRSRDPIVQVVAVLLVLLLFLPGHWLYLILRPRYTLVELYERSLEEEALLQELEDQKACPTCRRRVSDEFLLCPSCRTQLKEACRSCAKPLSYAWLACPFCGLEKPPREGMGARPVRAPARPAAIAGAKAAVPPRAPAAPPRVPAQRSRALESTVRVPPATKAATDAAGNGAHPQPQPQPTTADDEAPVIDATLSERKAGDVTF